MHSLGPSMWIWVPKTWKHPAEALQSLQCCEEISIRCGRQMANIPIRGGVCWLSLQDLHHLRTKLPSNWSLALDIIDSCRKISPPLPCQSVLSWLLRRKVQSHNLEISGSAIAKAPLVSAQLDVWHPPKNVRNILSKPGKGCNAAKK